MAIRLLLLNQAKLPKTVRTSVEIVGSPMLRIGRGVTMDWVLPDESLFVSSHHCDIRQAAIGLDLLDRSTNGTLINDEPVGDEARPLADGDLIKIGGYQIVVTVERVRRERETTHVKPSSNWPHQPPLEQQADHLAHGRDAADRVATGGAARSGDDEASRTPPPTLRGSDPAKTLASRFDDDGADVRDIPITLIRSIEKDFDNRGSSKLPSRLPPRSSESAPVVEAVARELGLSVEHLAQTDPITLAAQLAKLVVLTAGELKSLRELQSTSGPISAADEEPINNPLETCSTVSEALKVLFGSPRPDYLDAGRAYRKSFLALRDHDRDIASAWQTVVKHFTAMFDPAEIDREAQPRGLKRWLPGSHRRFRDIYVERWSKLTDGSTEGAVTTLTEWHRQACKSGRF